MLGPKFQFSSTPFLDILMYLAESMIKTSFAAVDQPESFSEAPANLN